MSICILLYGVANQYMQHYWQTSIWFRTVRDVDNVTSTINEFGRKEGKRLFFRLLGGPRRDRVGGYERYSDRWRDEHTVAAWQALGQQKERGDKREATWSTCFVTRKIFQKTQDETITMAQREGEKRHERHPPLNPAYPAVAAPSQPSSLSRSQVGCTTRIAPFHLPRVCLLW